jgi:hypothetical protein
VTIRTATVPAATNRVNRDQINRLRDELARQARIVKW